MRHYVNNETDSALYKELKYSQLLQEKNDSEQFLKLIAPKYLGVYVVDKQTDQFREIITPEFSPYKLLLLELYSYLNRLRLFEF